MESCESIARLAHAGQFRRDGVTPYIKHVEAVVARVQNDRTKCVAWLHDVIEDCGNVYSGNELLKMGVPFDIVDAVETLTRRKADSYFDFISRVKLAGFMAEDVKKADLLANLSDDPTDVQIRRYATALLWLTEVSP